MKNGYSHTDTLKKETGPKIVLNRKPKPEKYLWKVIISHHF